MNKEQDDAGAIVVARLSSGGERAFFTATSRRTDRPADALFGVLAAAGVASVACKANANAKVPALFLSRGPHLHRRVPSRIKAGAQRFAAQHGVALVALGHESARRGHAPGESAAWDFGVGAGFTLDATQGSPGRGTTSDVLACARRSCARRLSGRTAGAGATRLGIFGHSMGRNGALMLALRNPDIYRSVSAFAPIAALARCLRGAKKALTGYLGDDREAWKAYDASELLVSCASSKFCRRAFLLDQDSPISSSPSKLPEGSRQRVVTRASR